MSVIILLGQGGAAQNMHDIVQRCAPGMRIARAFTLEQLNEITLTPDTWLVSHSTSVIVPTNVLETLQGRAVNIHAASPDYPGRDPHHFAIYDGVACYGATAHVMTPKVDDGAILDVEWFDVAAGETPTGLLAKANAAALRVAERIVPKLLNGTAAPSGDRWGARKTTRCDFQALCEVRPDMDAAEIERRRRAVAVPGRANLFVELSGLRFTCPEPDHP